MSRELNAASSRTDCDLRLAGDLLLGFASLKLNSQQDVGGAEKLLRTAIAAEPGHGACRAHQLLLCRLVGVIVTTLCAQPVR